MDSYGTKVSFFFFLINFCKDFCLFLNLLFLFQDLQTQFPKLMEESVGPSRAWLHTMLASIHTCRDNWYSTWTCVSVSGIGADSCPHPVPTSRLSPRWRLCQCVVSYWIRLSSWIWGSVCKTLVLQVQVPEFNLKNSHKTAGCGGTQF